MSDNSLHVAEENEQFQEQGGEFCQLKFIKRINIKGNKK